MEGQDGRVGDCSGETEVAFQACKQRPCAGRSQRNSHLEISSRGVMTGYCVSYDRQGDDDDDDDSHHIHY